MKYLTLIRASRCCTSTSARGRRRRRRRRDLLHRGHARGHRSWPTGSRTRCSAVRSTSCRPAPGGCWSCSRGWSPARLPTGVSQARVRFTRRQVPETRLGRHPAEDPPVPARLAGAGPRAPRHTRRLRLRAGLGPSRARRRAPTGLRSTPRARLRADGRGQKRSVGGWSAPVGPRSGPGRAAGNAALRKNAGRIDRSAPEPAPDRGSRASSKTAAPVTVSATARPTAATRGGGSLMPRRGERSPKVIPGDRSDQLGFAALVEAYLEAMAVRNYPAKTMEAISYNLTYLIRWVEDRGVSRPSEVTKPILDRYQRASFTSQARRHAVSFRSQVQRLAPVRALFKWLCRHNQLLSNPASDLEFPRAENRLPREILSRPRPSACSACPTSRSRWACGIGRCWRRFTRRECGGWNWSA